MCTTNREITNPVEKKLGGGRKNKLGGWRKKKLGGWRKNKPEGWRKKKLLSTSLTSSTILSPYSLPTSVTNQPPFLARCLWQTWSMWKLCKKKLKKPCKVKLWEKLSLFGCYYIIFQLKIIKPRHGNTSWGKKRVKWWGSLYHYFFSLTLIAATW